MGFSRDSIGRTRVVVTMGLVGVLALAACSSSSKATSNGGTTAQHAGSGASFDPSVMNKPQHVGTPVAGGSLTFGLEAAVSTLVPGRIVQPSDLTVAASVYDPIVGFDDRGLYAPTGLASSWTKTPDLKQWTFTLRPNVTFSDGTPANAAAVVTQLAALKKLPHCSCAADVAHVLNVEAVDDLTVRFTLDQANVAFPQFLASGAGYLAAPAAWASPDTMTSHPIGTGAFRSITDGKLSYTRNSSYWRKSASGHALPYLDKITFVAIPDSTARLSKLRSGDVDILQSADTQNLVQAKRDPNLVVQPVTGSSATIVVLNSHQPPFDDIRMRQAFNYALDREALNKAYFGDSRTPAYGPLEPSNPYYDAKGQLPGHDLAKAKELVAQVKRDGKSTTVTALCINTPQASSQFATIAKEEQAAGIGATLKTVDQVSLVVALQSRSANGFEAACFRNVQIADPDVLYSTYYRTGGSNISLTSDLALDVALRQGRRSTDVNARKAAYDTAQELLAKDITTVPLLFDLYGNIHTKQVSGLSTPRPNALGLIEPGDLYFVQR